MIVMVLAAATIFVSVDIMYGFAVELAAMLCGTLASLRESAFIALAVVIVVVNMAMKFIAVIPRSGSDEDAAIKPLGAVVSVRRAAIGGSFVIAVGAGGRGADTYRYLGRSFTGRNESQCSNR